MSKRTINIEKEARGLIAWFKEFVAGATDNNGISVYDDLDQFMCTLEGEMDEISADWAIVEIPDIRSDEEAVQVIDELKYRLKYRLDSRKERPPGVSVLTPVADAMNEMLDDLIRHLGLDTDPHAFATLPERQELPGVVRNAKGEAQKLSPLLSHLLHARIKKDRDRGKTDTGIALELGIMNSGQSFLEALEADGNSPSVDAAFSKEDALKDAWFSAAYEFVGANDYLNEAETVAAVERAYRKWRGIADLPKSVLPESKGITINVELLPPGHKLGGVTYRPSMPDKEQLVFEGTIAGVTVRSCLDCGALVAGGPTRCGFCAAKVRGDSGKKFIGRTMRVIDPKHNYFGKRGWIKAIRQDQYCLILRDIDNADFDHWFDAGQVQFLEALEWLAGRKCRITDEDSEWWDCIATIKASMGGQYSITVGEIGEDLHVMWIDANKVKLLPKEAL